MNKATMARRGVTPTVTLHNMFAYAGHTFAVLIYEDGTSNDVSWSVESTFAGSFNGGAAYPTVYAVMEAVECIENALAKWGIQGDNIFELVNGLITVTRTLIARNALDGVN